MGEDLDEAAHARLLREGGEGDEARAVVVVAGIVEDEVGHRVDAELGQPADYLDPRALEDGYRLAELAEEHAELLAPAMIIRPRGACRRKRSMHALYLAIPRC